MLAGQSKQIQNPEQRYSDNPQECDEYYCGLFLRVPIRGNGSFDVLRLTKDLSINSNPDAFGIPLGVKKKRESDAALLARVKREQAKPRLTKSVRDMFTKSNSPHGTGAN